MIVSNISVSSVPLPLCSESIIVFLIEQKSYSTLLSTVKSLHAQTIFGFPLTSNSPNRVSCAFIPNILKILQAIYSLKQLFVYDKSVGFFSADGGNFSINCSPLYSIAIFFPLAPL